MLLLTIFGAMALMLAALAIYGLMAYSLAQRAPEMGIRMALGADSSSIRRLVLWQGMKLALVGLAGGLATAFASSRFLTSLLFAIKAWDPATFVGVSIIFHRITLNDAPQMYKIWRDKKERVTRIVIDRPLRNLQSSQAFLCGERLQLQSVVCSIAGIIVVEVDINAV